MRRPAPEERSLKMSRTRPRQILCVSFSPIYADSRVLRQLEVLRQQGEVTTVGYGPAPAGVKRHIEVPGGASSLPETPLGVARLALRRHGAVELTSPGEKKVRRQVVESGPYDLVVANDARALPLAFLAADVAPVYADMHEWAAEERATVLVWRLLVGPYFEALCRKYLPRVAAVTSVSAGLAKLYSDTYGIPAEVVRSAADFQSLEPTPVDPEAIRLVHSGTADAERNIVELIDAVDRLGDRFTLDLYLLEVPGGHLDVIRKKAEVTPRVTLHPPVPPETLPRVLNQYDLGVFLYPLKTLSHLHHLPNKFFDFVQARLGLVFSPAPEIDAHIGKYGLGLITADTTADALVDALRNITAEDVRAYKEAADKAARALSSGPDRATQSALVSRLLAGDR
jgi:glycosyltransferase involved in cell wall biosynthesis